ncbi:MAG: general secretion pathway protein GspK, partial [Thermodesulfovibrionales bacterium]|nr:general secretion pathway protein GspK [Thermodesulfovibrionales bacterium]
METFNNRGSALIAVLSITALIVALLTEFIYSIYISTISYDYWSKSQTLSLACRSGIALSAKAMTEARDIYYLSPSGTLVMPVEKVTESFQGQLILTAFDENSRFNINSLVYQNGEANPVSYEMFKRLLKSLDIDDKVADLIVDWIDRDKFERVRGAEELAKDGYLDTVDELYQIKGLNSDVLEKLIPYVTVYGYDRIDSSVINVNSAPVPVLMAIDERITRDLAERITQYRSLEPLKNVSDITKISGFEGVLGQSIIGKIATKVRKIRIFSSAEQDGVKRIIEAVVELQGTSQI